jgi:hypothetical protein
MSYISRFGKRPFEYASKASHGQILKDEAVRSFLANSDIPKSSEDIVLPEHQLITFSPVKVNPVNHIISIDGGFEIVPVQNEFPSSLIGFFQFGALIFSTEDLENISKSAFIDPEQISKLKQIQRLKLAIPIKNLVYKKEHNLTNSIRHAIYDHFMFSFDDEESLISSLCWFIFREFDTPVDSWELAHCPKCQTARIYLKRQDMEDNYTFHCDYCNDIIYLTDVFRLHEAVDDELGAEGIAGILTTAFEQILLIHIIKLIIQIKPSLLSHVLFIKDGPLAFFSQTANLHKPMRELIRYLFNKHDIFLAGLEKSGPFVEHAHQLRNILPPSTVFLLNNDYIYKYIIPGRANENNIYGQTTYYSNKLIYKTSCSSMYVVTLPTVELLASPKPNDLHNYEVILSNIENLRCDMYDNSLMPIALVNKLVSLSQFPSSRILQRFAKKELGQKTW